MTDREFKIHRSTHFSGQKSGHKSELFLGSFPNPPSQMQLMQTLIQRGGTLIVVETTDQDRRLWVRGIVGPRPSLSTELEPGPGSGPDWYCGLLEAVAVPPLEDGREPDFGTPNWTPLWTQLLQEALKIGGESQAKSMTAPLNESSWFGYRLRLDDHPVTYPWEPKRYPGLLDSFTSLGFSPGETYRSVGSTGLGQLAARVESPYKLSLENGFTYCSLDAFVTENQRSEALKTLWDLCNRAFDKGPYFAPISLSDFAHFYVGGLNHPNQKSLNVICQTANGTIAGFLFGYLADQELVFKSMAIDRPYQGQRLGDAILYPMAKQGLDQGIDGFVSALVLQGNRSEFVFRKNTTRWEHHYGVFRRA